MGATRLVALFSVLLLRACGTSRLADAERRSVSSRVESLMRDSVFVHDSIFVEKRADTVIRERVRTLYRERVRVDTFLLRDTLVNERVETVEKVVRRPFSFWWLLLVAAFFFFMRRGGL
jgi:hypothetical protein